MIDPLEEIQTMLVDCKSLIIASVEKNLAIDNADPHASYAPFLYADGCFYILISEMARHARNLAEARKASIMLIRDESDSSNLFARHRLTLDCFVEEVPYNGDDWFRITHKMEQKFGSIIKQLRSFTDIHLFRIRSEGGRYVRGFGQAFYVNDTLDDATPITGEGHKTVDPAKDSDDT